jgi:signal transduction histidine kinase
VLGVLRSADGSDDVEQPQPTLAQLPALLADSREAGTEVTLDTSHLAEPLGQVPTTLSRNAFRVVQEALTNARKHAPSAPVRVVLAGGPGEELEVEVSNPIGARGRHRAPVGGCRLTGLTERAVWRAAPSSTAHAPTAPSSWRRKLPWQT